MDRLSLQTDRLLLRQFREEDIDAYAAMCADPEVMRFLGAGQPVGREEAWRQLALLAGHWQLRGYGMWALEERTTGRLVGRAGLHFPHGWPEPEVGWTLARAFWGKGLAYEAARACLDHAFNDLTWDRACSLIAAGNRRSIALAERLGERFERTVAVRGFDVSLYAVSAEAYRLLHR